MLKTVVLLNIFMETVIYLFSIFWWIEFINILNNVFTVTFKYAKDILT